MFKLLPRRIMDESLIDTQIIPRQKCTNIAEKTAVYIPKPQTQTHTHKTRRQMYK